MDYNEQAVLLMELFEEIKAENRTKKQKLAALHDAGILTKNGKFTKHYPALKALNEKKK